MSDPIGDILDVFVKPLFDVLNAVLKPGNPGSSSSSRQGSAVAPTLVQSNANPTMSRNIPMTRDVAESTRSAGKRFSL